MKKVGLLLILLFVGTTAWSSPWDIHQKSNVDGDMSSPGTIAFSSPTITIQENQKFLTYSITRSSGSSGSVSVDIKTLDGSAKSGLDYNPYQVNIPWADGVASTKQIKVDLIIDDTVAESTKTFSLVMSQVYGGATLDVTTMTVHIFDDETPIQPTEPKHGAFKIEYDTYTAVNTPENIGVLPIKVLRVNGHDGDVWVTLRTTDIYFPDAGVEYMPAVTTFHFVDQDDDPQYFYVQIIDDAIPEDDNKGFQVDLTDLTGGATLANAGSYVYFIKSDDIPTPDAGPDLVMTAGDTIIAESSVNVYVPPVHGTWELVNSTDPVTLHPIFNDFHRQIQCDVPGQYRIRFRVDVGLTASKYDEMTLLVLPKLTPEEPQTNVTLGQSKNIFTPMKGDTAEIRYSLNDSGVIKIIIYDRLGREVIQLADRSEGPGSHMQIWNGRDSSGDIVKGGVYTAYIQEKNQTRRLKIIVLD